MLEEMQTPHAGQKNASLLRRLSYAGNGVTAALKREQSLRVQIGCGFLVLAFCLVTRPPAIWCGLFSLATALVITLELINTALEALIDRLHPEIHAEIGFAKDCLAGAVLVTSLGAATLFAIYLAAVYL